MNEVKKNQFATLSWVCSTLLLSQLTTPSLAAIPKNCRERLISVLLFPFNKVEESLSADHFPGIPQAIRKALIAANFPATKRNHLRAAQLIRDRLHALGLGARIRPNLANTGYMIVCTLRESSRPADQGSWLQSLVSDMEEKGVTIIFDTTLSTVLPGEEGRIGAYMKAKTLDTSEVVLILELSVQELGRENLSSDGQHEVRHAVLDNQRMREIHELSFKEQLRADRAGGYIVAFKRPTDRVALEYRIVSSLDKLVKVEVLETGQEIEISKEELLQGYQSLVAHQNKFRFFSGTPEFIHYELRNSPLKYVSSSSYSGSRDLDEALETFPLGARVSLREALETFQNYKISKNTALLRKAEYSTHSAAHDLETQKALLIADEIFFRSLLLSKKDISASLLQDPQRDSGKTLATITTRFGVLEFNWRHFCYKYNSKYGIDLSSIKSPLDIPSDAFKAEFERILAAIDRAKNEMNQMESEVKQLFKDISKAGKE